jgi:hypothetical protein
MVSIFPYDDMILHVQHFFSTAILVKENSILHFITSPKNDTQRTEETILGISNLVL